MKPCVCGGSNDNCRYCSGSGYVPDRVGLPRTEPAPKSFAPIVTEVRASEPKPIPASDRPLFESEPPKKGLGCVALVIVALFLLLLLVMR